MYLRNTLEHILRNSLLRNTLLRKTLQPVSASCYLTNISNPLAHISLTYFSLHLHDIEQLHLPANHTRMRFQFVNNKIQQNPGCQNKLKIRGEKSIRLSHLYLNLPRSHISDLPPLFLLTTSAASLSYKNVISICPKI